MKILIEEVLRLQPTWTHLNTPQMQRRGQLIRQEMCAWLRANRDTFISHMGTSGFDLEFEGRDGTGPKSEIPWVRYYSAARSPSAHQGWYCVYLFAANGERAYLCLGHGSTRYENGEFRPRPKEELSQLVGWARELIGEKGHISTDIALESKGALGRAYEQGTVFSIAYPLSEVPDNKRLLDDASLFAEFLATIYDAEDLGRSPDRAASELQAAQQILDAIAAPIRSRQSGHGQGFGLSAEERSVVDRHAMKLASDYLTGMGFDVKDVSRNHPYDFIASKDAATLIVEVKGTTGSLGNIFLTANEVLAHRERYPANALLIVHSIELNRKAKPPIATGGTAHFLSPWSIHETSLKPLSYQYALMTE